MMLEDSPVLSRNRHFHTFDNPEGRYALKISRRLKSLRDFLVECQKARGQIRVSRSPEIQLHMAYDEKRRTTQLTDSEYELLLELPGAREALQGDE